MSVCVCVCVCVSEREREKERKRERERERGRINSDILQQGEGELEKNIFLRVEEAEKGQKAGILKKKSASGWFY